MARKLILFFVLTSIAIAISYYFFTKNSVNLLYEEPNPVFFSESLIDSDDIVVKITDLGFEPETITIKKGDKITWVNSSNGYAWPASNPHPTHTNYQGFDPQLPMKTNQAWSYTFDTVGSWGYHDHLDPAWRGRVDVTE